MTHYASLRKSFTICHFYYYNNPIHIVLYTDLSRYFYYRFIGGQWMDDHSPPTVLTDKMAIKIYIQIDCFSHVDSEHIKHYNVTKTILVKTMCQQHLIIDLFKIIFDTMD